MELIDRPDKIPTSGSPSDVRLCGRGPVDPRVLGLVVPFGVFCWGAACLVSGAVAEPFAPFERCEGAGPALYDGAVAEPGCGVAVRVPCPRFGPTEEPVVGCDGDCGCGATVGCGGVGWACNDDAAVPAPETIGLADAACNGELWAVEDACVGVVGAVC